MDTELLNQLIVPLLAFGLSFVFALGAVAAFLGGSLGTKVMQTRLNPGTVKTFLGVLLLMLALKMALQLFE